jgi:large subunit ribosomal protein L10
VNRTEKQALVEKLTGTFGESPHAILARYSGLTVNQASDLRRRIRRAGGGYRVVKNRLARRAATATPIEGLAGMLKGPCAIATHASDPVSLAKVLTDFCKDNPQLELVAGVIDARQLADAAGLKRLAALPALPELRAQLLALIQTPATTLVRMLGTPGTQLARALDARREKLGGGA